MEEESVYVAEKKDQKSANTALWILLLLSLAANAFLAYNYYKNNFSGGKSLKTENEELLTAIKSLNFSKDSLQKEFDAVYKQFQDAASQSIASNEEKSKIEAELEQKKIQVARLLAQGGGPALLKAKAEIENLKKDLAGYQVRIEQMQQENDQYASKVSSLQEESNQMSAKAQKAESENLQLNKKISNSNYFQVSDFSFMPYRTKRGAAEETGKAGKVEGIKIAFELIPSDIIEQGDKKVSVRIIGTNGEILTNNNDVLEDSEQLVTHTHDFNYTGDNEKVSFTFKQKAAYKKGEYGIEIVQDGRLLTKGTFVLE